MEDKNIFDLISSINESLTEAKKEKEELPVVDEKAVKQPVEEDTPAQPRVGVVIPPDGSLAINTGGKTIAEDPDGTVRISIAENATDSDILKMLDEHYEDHPHPNSVKKVDDSDKVCPKCKKHPCECEISDVEKFQRLEKQKGEIKFKDLKDFNNSDKNDVKEELKAGEKKEEDIEKPKVVSEETIRKVLPKKPLYENKLFKSHTNTFLSQYLPENLEFKPQEITLLTESEKSEIMRNIAHNIIDAISDRLANVDTSAADRSRGDIKSLKELADIQVAITQLETILDRSGTLVPGAREYLGTIVKAILYLNQYNKVFKDAYRTKKTLLILRYQSLILAVISSVSYLISALLEFANEDIQLKKIIKIEEIAPLKTLAKFNQSVESGEFKIIINDVAVLREYYNEYSVEEMNKLLEATDIMGLITSGIKTLYTDLDTSDRLTSMLYKATGIVVLLLSIRDLVYTFARMKTKAGEMIEFISKFANINNGGLLRDLGQAAAKLKVDSEVATEITDSEVRSENKKLATEIKAAQLAPVITGRPERPVIPPAEDIFSIDF